jgi:carboxymethylenebutenolidase
MRWFGVLAVLALVACNSNAPSQPAQSRGPVNYGTAAPLDELVTFPSGSLQLYGYLYVPPGNGPFPAIVWNHGSGEEPGSGKLMSQWYIDNGFVMFYPHRRGHGRSAAAGKYIGDLIDETHLDQPTLPDALVAQSDDVIAAAAYLATQPDVDRTRISTVGCSFGGIEALFAAEQGTGLVSAIDFAGASHMWARAPALRERMKVAARNAKIPVFFIQAANDADTTPTLVLAEEMKRAGKPHRAQVFPPYGTSVADGHGFCGLTDNPPWGPQVLDFLTETMRIGR